MTIKSVERWEASDGQIFITQEKAQEYEQKTLLGKIIQNHHNIGAELSYCEIIDLILKMEKDLAEFFGWLTVDLRTVPPNVLRKAVGLDPIDHAPNPPIEDSKKDRVTIDASWALISYDLDRGAIFERRHSP